MPAARIFTRGDVRAALLAAAQLPGRWPALRSSGWPGQGCLRNCQYRPGNFCLSPLKDWALQNVAIYPGPFQDSSFPFRFSSTSFGCMVLQTQPWRQWRGCMLTQLLPIEPLPQAVSRMESWSSSLNPLPWTVWQENLYALWLSHIVCSLHCASLKCACPKWTADKAEGGRGCYHHPFSVTPAQDLSLSAPATRLMEPKRKIIWWKLVAAVYMRSDPVR